LPWHDVRAVTHRAKPLTFIHFYDAVRLEDMTNITDFQEFQRRKEILDEKLKREFSSATLVTSSGDTILPAWT
ncbi:MAG TPA: hypothetical protein VHG31_07840, partial [Stellaceae bacterium]|nr:hypothetical protein [Stellaceae bacterium]